MRVIRAEVIGMCFGVRDALAVIDGIKDPQSITIHGELVHNEIVQSRLRSRGFHTRDEANRSARLPETPTVLVTAHGISNRERSRLLSAGKTIVDTTCPLVSRVHHAAQALASQGYHVVVIGRKEHVEVQGIIGDLDAFDVIESAEDVRNFGLQKIGIVCQTTATEKLVSSLFELISAKNPLAQIKFMDTVCGPTRDHQRALDKLLALVDAVVVVGGLHSNNTRALVSRARESGRPAFHVQSAADLDPAQLSGVDRVGLTAGTSTLAETIDEVERALEQIG